jgi:hypothetical protein
MDIERRTNAMLQSQVYVQGDLAAMLASLALTAAATGGHSPADRQFQRGFAAALVAMGVALHIDPAELAELAGPAMARLAT